MHMDNNDYLISLKEIYMARHHPEENSYTLEDQLRALGNDELLDFWEESQLLDKYFDASVYQLPPSKHYEAAILQELQLRHTMGRI